MRNIVKISMLTIVAMSMAQAEVRYDVKSAKIEFKTKSTQTVGSITIEKTGTKKVLIDNYGEKEFVERQELEKRDSKENKMHTLRYINGTVAYGVDFEHKMIHRMEGYMGDVFGVIKGDGTNEEMLKKMKFKKTGIDKVAGQSCDVWEMKGGIIKQCIYKGLPLREETNMMGMKSLVVATKVEIDATLSKDDFKLPDFPIDGKKYTQSEREEMDAKDKERANERKKEQDNAMNIMAEAFKKAGVKEGKSPTPEQMKIARGYMENAMFPITKKEILKKIKEIPTLKKCFEKANNMKEAYACDPDEDFKSNKWGESEKKAIIKELEVGEKSLPCIEKAKNMKDIKACFPEDDE